MEASGYISLSLATALRHDLDVTANNIANANTAGFKGEHVAFDAMLETSPSGLETEFVIDVGSYVDTRQGALTHTGNPLDIRIRISKPKNIELIPDRLEGVIRVNTPRMSKNAKPDMESHLNFAFISNS